MRLPTLNTQGKLPGFVRFSTNLLPAYPMELALKQLIKSIAKAHPNMFDRLGEYAELTYAIDPSDLPFTFLLKPDGKQADIEVIRSIGFRPPFRPHDARIAGPLLHLIGMIDGTYDGDALFFSRDIIIEGNTEAVLALRNAIDDAEVDLIAETFTHFGPIRGTLDNLTKQGIHKLREILNAPGFEREKNGDIL